MEDNSFFLYHILYKIYILYVNVPGTYRHQARKAAAAGDSMQAGAATAVKLPFTGKILPYKTAVLTSSVAEPATPSSSTTRSASSLSLSTLQEPPTKLPSTAATPLDVSSVKKALFPAGPPPGRPPSTSLASNPSRSYREKENELWSKLFK